MTFSTPVHTNEQSFDRVLATGLPLLVVWHRPQSPVGAALDKELGRLAIQFEGRALIAKINVADNPKLTADYSIDSTPTLLLMRNGEVAGRTSGDIPAPELKAALEALVAGKPLPKLSQGQSERYSAAEQQAGKPLVLTDATFAQAINGPKPVLVDFWAAWCGPCRMIAPSIDTLAQEFAGKAVVAKLNVDENPATSQRFQVQSIPMLLIFKNGAVVDQIVGVQPVHVLRQRLQQVV